MIKYNQMIKRLIFIFFIVLVLIPFKPVTSQINTFDGEDLIVNIVPDYPEPNSIVSISLESYAFDLDASVVEWSINGKNVSKKIGNKKLNFKTSNLNTQTNISITVTTNDGRVINKNFSISPTSIDMLWEADTYTPPFFKGKPMFTRQSAVYVYANPHIYDQNNTEIPKEKLIYKWKKDDDSLYDISGYGKFYIKINGSILGRDMEIEVEATDPNTSKVAYGSVIISPTDPMVLFYEKDPLTGIRYERALDEKKITDKTEVELYAMPYFFSAKNPKSLIYTWSLNGDTINDRENATSRVFRKIKDVFGTAFVNVSIEDTSKIMQSGQSSVKINFPKPINKNESVI
jgi:hypothetical protein